MRSGVCYPREPLGRTTAAGGCGLLPTPLASDATRGGNTRYSDGNPSLSLALRQLTVLPTPTVKGNYNRASYSDRAGDGLVTALKKMLPTPLASDYRSSSRQMRHGQYSARLPEVLTREAGGENCLLNPDFVEWMMGWPIGMTALEPLAEARFRWWLRQHGGC